MLVGESTHIKVLFLHVKKREHVALMVIRALNLVQALVIGVQVFKIYLKNAFI